MNQTKCKVVYKIKGGTWNDGTKEPIVEYVEENSTPSFIPKMMIKGFGRKAQGSWDEDPHTSITEDTEFTFTFKRNPVYAVTACACLALLLASTVLVPTLISSSNDKDNGTGKVTDGTSVANDGVSFEGIEVEEENENPIVSFFNNVVDTLFGNNDSDNNSDDKNSNNNKGNHNATYTITWVDENGTKLYSEEVGYGEMPVYGGTIPTKAADDNYKYAFAGWTPAYEVVTSAKTYTAKYNKTLNALEVTLVDNGHGNAPETITVEYRGTLKEENIKLSATGYIFDGWFTDEALEIPFNYETKIIKKTVLYAKWTAKTYKDVNLNDKDGKPITDADGDPVDFNPTYGETTPSLPEDVLPSKPGYDFDGFYDEEEPNGEKYIDKDGKGVRDWDIDKENSELYPHFTPKEYDITLDNGDGTKTPLEVTFDQPIPAIPSTDIPEKDGYTFQGYYDEENGEGTKYYNADGTSAIDKWENVLDEDEEFNLYPYFKANKYNVILNANANDAIDGVTSVEVTYDAEMPSLSFVATRTGYTLAGYYDEDGNKYYNGNGTSALSWNKAEDNVILYAHWSANENTAYKVNVYKEKLTLDGYDLEVIPMTGITGKNVSLNEIDYKCDGFTFDSNKDNVLEGVIAGDGSLELSIYYSRDKYTITWTGVMEYDILGGVRTVNPTSNELPYGSTPVYVWDTSDIITKEFTYKFKGWTPNIENVTGSQTYTAVYEKIANLYDVTVNVADSSNGMGIATLENGNTSGSFKYGDSVTIKAVPNEGYRFVKWNDGSVEISRQITIIEDVTYTAEFELDAFNITVNNSENGQVEVYEVLDYIKSDGSQCIDTGVYPNDTTMFQIRFKNLACTPNIIIGNKVGDELDSFRLYNGRSMQIIFLNYGSGHDENGGGDAEGYYRIEGGELKVGEEYYFEVGNRYVYDLINHKTLISSTEVHFEPKDYTILWSQGSSNILYSLKIYDNNELIRDYIPVRQSSTGDVGLLDKVENKFYASTTGSNFEASSNGFVSTQPLEDRTTYTFMNGTKVLLAAKPDEGYKFASWNDGSDTTPFKNVTVTEDASYSASFEKEQYTVTWKNGDEVIGTSTVYYGDTPVYTGEEPTKLADAQYTYIFDGWDNGSTPVTGDTTCTAKYKNELNEYDITFKDENGTVLQTSKVAYGVMPSYTRATPTKDADDLYIYTFNGWTPALESVTGPAEYTVVFSKTSIAKGNVIKLNDNNNYRVLSIDEETNVALVLGQYYYSQGLMFNQTFESQKGVFEGTSIKAMKYSGSNLDNYYKERYNELASSCPNLYNAIVPTDIYQGLYTKTSGEATGEYFAKGPNYYIVDCHSKELIKDACIFALDINDLVEYLGKDNLNTTEINNMFGNNISKNILWLRSACGNNDNYIFQISSLKLETYESYYGRLACPAFYIDLTSPGLTIQFVKTK